MSKASLLRRFEFETPVTRYSSQELSMNKYSQIISLRSDCRTGWKESIVNISTSIKLGRAIQANITSRGPCDSERGL